MNNTLTEYSKNSLLSLFAIAVLLSACSNDGKGKFCLSGETQLCLCDVDVWGAQSCEEDGKSWGECICEVTTESDTNTADGVDAESDSDNSVVDTDTNSDADGDSDTDRENNTDTDTGSDMGTVSDRDTNVNSDVNTGVNSDTTTGVSVRETCPGEVIDVSNWRAGQEQSLIITGSTVGAADNIDEENDVSCWSSSSAAEHVLQFTPPENLLLEVTLEGSNYDTKLAIVSSCPEGSDFCMYNNDYLGFDSGFPCAEFIGGVTYTIIISGFGGDTGDYVLNMSSCDAVVTDTGVPTDTDDQSGSTDTVAANRENCPGEVVDLSDWQAGEGQSISVTGSILGAWNLFDEEEIIDCWQDRNSRENVFQFTPPEDMFLQVDFEGSEYGNAAAIVSSCSSGSEFCVYDDDTGGTDTRFECMAFQGGQTYHVIISGRSGYREDYVLNIDECGGDATDTGIQTDTQTDTRIATDTITGTDTAVATDTSIATDTVVDYSAREDCSGELVDISDWYAGGGEWISVTGTTVGATSEIYESTDVECWSGDHGAEHVLRFIPSEDLSLQIDFIDSSFDTKVAIVSSCPWGQNFCMFNDDFSGKQSGFSCTEFPGGVAYAVIISGFNGATGDYSLNIAQCAL